MGKLDKAHEEELAAQLEEWGAQVTLYQAKAHSATAEAKNEYFEITKALQRMQDEVQMKLHDLKAASDEELEDLRTDTKKAWDEVKSVVFYGAASESK